MDYKIQFDEENNNLIKIYKDGKLYNSIACPPCENGCDVIRFNAKMSDGYTYNFSGLILITTNRKRKLSYLCW